MPAIILRSVDLPAPLRPVRPAASPRRTSKETSRSTSKRLGSVSRWCAIRRFRSHSTAAVFSDVRPAVIERYFLKRLVTPSTRIAISSGTSELLNDRIAHCLEDLDADDGGDDGPGGGGPEVGRIGRRPG